MVNTLTQKHLLVIMPKLCTARFSKEQLELIEEAGNKMEDGVNLARLPDLGESLTDLYLARAGKFGSRLYSEADGNKVNHIGHVTLTGPAKNVCLGIWQNINDQSEVLVLES